MFDIAIYDINGNPIEKLYQYDTCVKIQIKDLEFENKPIVHFSNKNSEAALAVPMEDTEYVGGTLTVEIPYPLLLEDLMIYVYLYTYDTPTKCGRTIHVGNIPVCSKPKPEDYIDNYKWKGINAMDMSNRIYKLEVFRDVTYVSEKNQVTEDINNEAINREQADINLESQFRMLVTNEESARINADGDLQNKIDTETQNRTNADTELQKQITSNKNAINVLNGTGEGSVYKQITDNFNDFTAKVSDDGVINTYKEAVDYIAEHGKEATTMMGNITKNTNAINELNTLVGVLPDSSAANSVVGYVDEEIFAVNDKIVAAENRVETNAKKYADQTFIPTNDLTVIFNTIYPVGAIYATKDSECIPDDLFGGTWQLDENMPIDTYYLWERLTLAE